MYAVIETGGKQLRVEEGQVIYVEKLDLEEGETVVFEEVIAVNNRTMKIGTPYVSGASVTARVDKHGKGKKVTVISKMSWSDAAALSW